MLFQILLLLFLCRVNSTDDIDDLGYDLHIGYAINVFANYGDLCQVTRVVSTDYEYESGEDESPFTEKNLKVYADATSRDLDPTGAIDDVMQLTFCNTLEELLDSFFAGFSIEGTNKPWKVFMGDWNAYEILRTFGIEFDQSPDINNKCCYVLAKLSKTDESVRLDDLTDDVTLKSYVQRSTDKLNVSDTVEVRRFMTEYGTHYINAYSTGNAVYQVFKFKRQGYNMLKAYVASRNKTKKWRTDNLRYYFSSLFLQQVGDIRVASGNKTVEKWARENLRDSQYLYSRPTIMRLYYGRTLVRKLEDMLDSGALLSMELKTLKPLFKDKDKAKKYAEIVENDMILWEVNI